MNALSDRRIDQLVTTLRPDVDDESSQWRARHRGELLAFIDNTEGPRGDQAGAAESAVAADIELIPFKPKPTYVKPSRRKVRPLLVAAMVAVLVGGLAVIGIRSDSPSPAVTDTPQPPLDPLPSMVEPGIVDSQAVRRLLALPTCSSNDGLAPWTVEQLAPWRNLDPAAAAAAEFSTVTMAVPIDTAAADSAACSAAITLENASAWGVRDAQGNWIARGTAVLEPGEYTWPKNLSENGGDDRLEGSIGTGQQFTEFAFDTDADDSTHIGALNAPVKSAPNPIYAIQLTDTVLDATAERGRLWFLRTTGGVLDEQVNGPADPGVSPTLVPEEFGRCTVQYVRTNPHGIGALAVDYCSLTATITVTAGIVNEGEQITVNNVDLMVDDHQDGVVLVGFAEDAMMLSADDTVPVEALASMLLSIPAVQNMTDQRTAPPDTTNAGGTAFSVNEAGQTYGDPDSVETDEYPDLLQVEATNGRVGYVDRRLLDELTGANVSTPEEPVEWQRQQDAAESDVTFIPVYEADGVTEIGEFPISRSSASPP